MLMSWIKSGLTGLVCILFLTCAAQTNVTFNTLYTFSGGDGSGPYSPPVQAFDGALYGTTREGGSNNLGTIFKITTDGLLTSLYSFQGNDGNYPEGPLTEANGGTLYGTTG
jgi:uncharacterized repeat protein (TIGR03803 family)